MLKVCSSVPQGTPQEALGQRESCPQAPTPPPLPRVAQLAY